MARDSRGTTKQRIVAAASREFAGDGFDAVSVQTISERAAVAHGTVFLHFASKSLLYQEVIKQAGDRFERAMGPQLERERLSLGQLFEALATHVGRHPEFAGLLSPRREGGGRMDRASKALHDLHVDFWREAVRRLEQQGDMRPCGASDNVARLLAATVTGLLATGNRNPAVDALAPMAQFPELANLAGSWAANGSGSPS